MGNQGHKIRVGVIGIGFGQQVHVPAFRTNALCEVVGICASSEERARKVAERLAVPRWFGRWQEMVGDARIDALSIAVPPALQTEIVLAALAVGKPVFCEKPLAVSYSAAEALAQAAGRAGVANVVDFEFPEVDAWRQAKEALTQIGDLRHVNISWHVETYANRLGLSSWKTTSAAGGGTLNGFVSHVFYNLEWFCGKIQRLSCRLFKTPGDERAGDTTAVLCMELACGAVLSASVSSQAFLGRGHCLEFYGSNGAVVLENRTSDYMDGFVLYQGTRDLGVIEEVIPVAQEHPKGSDGRVQAVGRVVDRFVNWMATGEPGGPSFADGLRVQRLIQAARRSDETKCWVEVE